MVDVKQVADAAGMIVNGYGTPNADTIEAIAEVEALKKAPPKKTYSTFAEIIAEANEEMGE